MGILTYISSTFDENREVQFIFAATKFKVSTRAQLNRVASRASVLTGVGQRTLVAAAYDELGIDMVWREGPFAVMSPEEKWPDAQDIEFHTVPMERSSEFFDIVDVPADEIPGGRLKDTVVEGIMSFEPESWLLVWEVPYEVGGRRQ